MKSPTVGKINSEDFDLINNIDLSSNVLYAWIEIFYKQANTSNILQAISNHSAYSSTISATVVGSRWHLFSEFMPWFLCLAAANVITNLKKSYICRTAYEEVGMGTLHLRLMTARNSQGALTRPSNSGINSGMAQLLR